MVRNLDSRIAPLPTHLIQIITESKIDYRVSLVQSLQRLGSKSYELHCCNDDYSDSMGAKSYNDEISLLALA